MLLRVEVSGFRFDNTAIPEVVRDRRLSEIVHEFSNALFVARGYVHLLEKSDTSLSEADQRHLAAISENMDRLVSAVRDLNALRSPEPPILIESSVPKSIRSVLSELRPILNYKKVALRENLTCTTSPYAGFPERTLPVLRGFLTAVVDVAAERGAIDAIVRRMKGRIGLRVSATGVRPDPNAMRELTKAVELWRTLGGRARIVSSDRCCSVFCDFPSARAM